MSECRHMVKWLDQIDRLDSRVVGGKAALLGGLKKAGFAVPNGFVVFENSTSDEVLDAFDRLGESEVAVRSSAVAEDGVNHSWAGELESFMNVSRADLVQRIDACRASSASDRAKSYAKMSGNAGSVAVLVQTMLASDISGVVFSAHPITGDRAQMMIEASAGLGEAVVSGLVTPEHVVVSSADGAVIEHQYEGAPLLTVNRIDELVHTVKKIEAWLGKPCDVEWAFENNRLWILQARPMTALPKPL